MAAPTRAPRWAPCPPAAPRRRRQRESAVRVLKRRGGGSWQGPSCQLRPAPGAHVTSSRACAVAGHRLGRFRLARRREGFVGNVRREASAAGEGASSYRHLCGGFC
ncbi:uncharacterized protein LOC134807195 [Pan troglodytes]|uniref:uncharacterized protein LOC134807195 n=1 Tax=Pan troglodytes TaxID=9598 RepID=UPI003013D3A3